MGHTSAVYALHTRRTHEVAEECLGQSWQMFAGDCTGHSETLWQGLRKSGLPTCEELVNSSCFASEQRHPGAQRERLAQ